MDYSQLVASKCHRVDQRRHRHHKLLIPCFQAIVTERRSELKEVPTVVTKDPKEEEVHGFPLDLHKEKEENNNCNKAKFLDLSEKSSKRLSPLLALQREGYYRNSYIEKRGMSVQGKLFLRRTSEKFYESGLATLPVLCCFTRLPATR